jgi:DNA-binding MarR family transcriptional regulator
MQANDDSAHTREFSLALWRVLKWTQKTLRVPSATPAFELLVALGSSAEMQSSYDELEALTRRSHRAMQYVIHDMRTMGLVEVKSGPEDRRRRIIRLSPAGLRLYREYCDLLHSEVMRLAGGMAFSPTASNGTEPTANLAGTVSIGDAGHSLKANREHA